MARFENKHYDVENSSPRPYDIVCLSHLRWDFVYQRPQHLLTRFAREHRVFFVEEPIYDAKTSTARLEVSAREGGVQVVVPHLPEGLVESVVLAAQEEMLERFFLEHGIHDYIFWYYTPMALGFTQYFSPRLVIYDCMDELSMFKFAPPMLKTREAMLFQRADLIFTGGASLYEHKRNQHPNVHLFPSSIDREHFGQARTIDSDPADQANIPHPRLGFFGVVDERMDIALLNDVAQARPDWHFVILGPVVKIDPAELPRHPNIHYLGPKAYKQLPAYLAGWDVALLPFARNDSTRFISPTKTPEYLAGGKPVVSTPIRDVVRPYGEKGLVWIAGTAPEFVAAAHHAMNLNGTRGEWLRNVDAYLAGTSWDNTWMEMRGLIHAALAKRTTAASSAARPFQMPAAVAGE